MGFNYDLQIFSHISRISDYIWKTGLYTDIILILISAFELCKSSFQNLFMAFKYILQVRAYGPQNFWPRGVAVSIRLYDPLIFFTITPKHFSYGKISVTFEW